MIDQNTHFRKYISLFSSLLTVVFLSLALVLSVGITFGRFYTSEQLALTFEPDGKRTPQINYANPRDGGGEWEDSDGVKKLEFSLTGNGGDNGCHFKVRLFVPTDDKNIADPLGGAKLTLTYGDVSCTAKRREIDTGTMLYTKHDSHGWIYYFETSGAEIVHHITEGGNTSLDMALVLSGNAVPEDWEIILYPVNETYTGNNT